MVRVYHQNTSAMGDNDAPLLLRDYSPDPSNARSVRSRASSVISTSTKFSVSTLPQDFAGSSNPGVDGLLAEDSSFGHDGLIRRSRPSRPMSVYSFRSIGESLPAYEEEESDPIVHANTILNSNNAAARGISRSPPLPSLPTPPLISPPLLSHSDDVNPEAPSPPIPKFTSVSSNPSASTPVSTTSYSLAPLPPPPSAILSDPAAIQIHYTALLTREISELRKTHSLELSSTRNSIDAAYRRELTSRTRSLERLRSSYLARESALTTRETDLENTFTQRQQDLEITYANDTTSREASVRRMATEYATKELALSERMDKQRTDAESHAEGLRTQYREELLDREHEWEAKLQRAVWAIEEVWEGRWKAWSELHEGEKARREDEGVQRLEGREREWRIRERCWRRVVERRFGGNGVGVGEDVVGQVEREVDREVGLMADDGDEDGNTDNNGNNGGGGGGKSVTVAEWKG